MHRAATPAPDVSSAGQPLRGCGAVQHDRTLILCTMLPDGLAAVDILQVLAKQSEPLCWACFDEDLLRLVRKAVRLKGLIRPGDRVLAALSGGALARPARLLACTHSSPKQRSCG